MALNAVEITLLVDNKAGPNMESEHGLAMWIETPDLCLLFDTGQGPALAANADRLGVDLGRVQTLVLSHGHYDHTGGVGDILRRVPEVDVFCHPGAVQPRYKIRSSGAAKAIHMPSTSMTALDKHAERRMHWISEPVRLSDDIGLTGPIPRRTAFEDVGGPFYLDPLGRRKDAITDDIALWINTTQGLVVGMGCCHAGLINTLHHVRDISGISTLRAVVGGFHLIAAGPERLTQTISGLEAFDPAAIVACHCTGEKAVAAFSAAMGQQFSEGFAGLRLSYP